MKTFVIYLVLGAAIAQLVRVHRRARALRHLLDLPTGIDLSGLTFRRESDGNLQIGIQTEDGDQGGMPWHEGPPWHPFFTGRIDP